MIVLLDQLIWLLCKKTSATIIADNKTCQLDGKSICINPSPAKAMTYITASHFTITTPYKVNQPLAQACIRNPILVEEQILNFQFQQC